MTEPKKTKDSPAETGATSTTLAGSAGQLTPDTGTQSDTPAAKSATPGNLSRNDATRVLVAIDELRKRTVKEIKQLRASLAKADDITKKIDLGQKERYLADLADLHGVVGTTYGLSGY